MTLEKSPSENLPLRRRHRKRSYWNRTYASIRLRIRAIGRNKNLHVSKNTTIRQEIFDILTVTVFHIIYVIFAFNMIRTAIYLPLLMKYDASYFPQSAKSNSEIFGDEARIVFGELGLANPYLLFSVFTMILVGMLVYCDNNSRRYLKLWVSTLLSVVTLCGILVTIFSVLG